MGPNTPENVEALLDEARKSTNANMFATSLLICLGHIKASTQISQICDSVTLTLI